MSTCTTSHATQQPHGRPSKPSAAPSKNVPSSITRNLPTAKTSNPSPPNVAPKDVGVLTPSIEAIWKSFVENGQGDVELLKLLLLTKSKEDERLTALDNLRTEQMRAANTMALHQYFYQYSAFYAAQQQQQQQQAHLVHQQQSSSTRAPSPYSPTSPPPAPSSSFTTSNKPSTKRPRAPSDASTVSNDSVSSSSSSSSNPATMAAPVKKARLAPSTKNASSKSPPPPPPPHSSNGSKPSHADVMELLRKKCQGNQGTSPGSQIPSPPSSSSNSFAPPPTPASSSSSTARKPSNSPPLRHSLMLRPALPPPSLDMPQVEQAQASEGGLSPVVEEGTRGGTGVDRLAMLLRAGEMKAESD
ncbi:hypothetical protein JCM5350_008351 [Sporobolomyces pararoseus]